MRRLPSTLVALCCLAGCSASPSPVRRSFPEVLRELWSAHGGLEAWRRHDAVACRIRVLDAGGATRLESVLRFRRGDGRTLVWDDAGRERVLRLDAAAPADAAGATDYYLRAARFLAFLPLALGDPGWQLHQDSYEGREHGHERGFWAVAPDAASPHLDYFLVVDEASGRLDRVYYQVRHPQLAGKVFMATYREPIAVGGLLLSRTITHEVVRELVPPVEERRVHPGDPFATARAIYRGGVAGSERSGADAGRDDARRDDASWTLVLEDLRFETLPDGDAAALFGPAREEPAQRSAAAER